MKCPRCGGVLNEYGDLFVCESCGAKFKNKSAQREQKQEEQVVQNTATESVIMPETKNESEKSELELLKERLAEMEKRQSEMESGGSHRNADFKGKFSQIKETKFLGFLKKWGLKVILPCVLAFIVLISLMVSLVGVRGVYYNVNNPNEFYSFSSSKYEYYGDFNGEEYVDKGTWKTKNGKLYLTYKDEEFGKQTDEYYFSKQSNKVIFIGEEKDSLSEFKRVSLSKYKPSSNKKVKITFDANGGSGDTSVSYSFGSKSKEVPQTEREGYFFKGWYKDKYGYKISGSKPYEEGKRVWEDVTYYANWWSDKTYTLTVEGTDIALELEEGDSLLSKLKETEKGYTYDYYIYGELVDENTRMPANSVTISRQQTSVKTIKLTLNAVGGNFNGVGEITKTVAYNSDFTLDVPKSKGMFFAGYVIYPKNSEACISVATHNGSLTNDFWNNVYEDVTLYASWIDLATELADFEYTINDDGIRITKYKGDKSTVEIPNGVVRLEAQAFKKCTFLTSITIPASVKSILSDAFYECDNLKTIFYIGDVASWCKISGLSNIMSNNRTLYIGGKKVEGDLVIPDNVTRIGDYAFLGCTGLTSVTIGNGVTSIGDGAFYGCTGLTSITIPNRVTSIGDSAFQRCTGLTTVNWNATECTSAGSHMGYIFEGCSNLATVNIGDNVTTIPSYAFKGCTGLTSITIPDSVTSIDWYAFSGCTGLTSVTIPDCVTSIGNYAFRDCTGLTSVTIGNGVTSIGNYAFEYCYKLVEVYNKSTLSITAGSSDNGKVAYYAKNVYKNEGGSKLTTDENGYVIYTDGYAKILVAYTGTETELTLPSDITKIYQNAFSGCTKLTSVTIPDSITSIGNYAFRGCTGLTSVTIGNGVTSIGDSAFEYCYKLVEVYNKSTLSITADRSGNGYVAYYAKNVYKNEGGSKLTTDENGYVIYTDGDEKILVAYLGTETKLTLPAYITQIYKYAFSGCTGLTSITIPNRVTSIGDSAFQRCTGLTSVTIGNGVTSIDDYAFYACRSLTTITIPDSVTIIGKGAFYDCAGLTSVTIGNGVTYIGESAFLDCTGLTTVNWNATACTTAGLQGYHIFRNCSKLTIINIGDKVTTIPLYAFYGCSGLTSVTIGNSVTSIGRYAFSGCTGLTSVTIGGSVTSIGYMAFSDCTRLTGITIPDSVTSIGSSAFDNTAWYKNQPNGLVYAGKVAYKYKGTMPNNTSIVLKEGTLGIGNFAFEDCRGLMSITIPDSVTSIGDGAFYGCTGLTSITIPNRVTSIGEGAFFECTGLTDIKFNGTITQWKAISKGTNWKYRVPATEVVCKDGTVSI